MKTADRALRHISHIFLGLGIFFLLIIFTPTIASAMTLTGPITASSVTVTGDVTVSSMTVSSLTVSSLLQVTGTTSGFPKSIVQMKFSSTTVATATSSSTFQAVPNLVKSMTLSDATNYIRISLTGMLSISDASTSDGQLTVERDGTAVLGSTWAIATSGLSATLTYLNVPVGITLTDAPGDINSHTYQVYIRTQSGSATTKFTDGGVGYLLLEEIRR
jgi:hypothetical protein